MTQEEGHKIPYSDFTSEMQRQAESEGWCLSERSDGYLEIQRCDDDPKHRFSSDGTAEAYVAERARNGSYLHQLAMHLDGTQYAVVQHS